MDENGWFADYEGDNYWVPRLQLPGGSFPLPVVFRTEAECEEFIKQDVVGKGFMEGSSICTPN